MNGQKKTTKKTKKKKSPETNNLESPEQCSWDLFRRQKTTTQRREEGQMKSCVTNNGSLPIPREIYFSGYSFHPKWYFEILFSLHNRPTEKYEKKAAKTMSTKDLTFQKTMGVKFLHVLLRFVFLMEFKSEKPQKEVNFKSSLEVELKISTTEEKNHRHSNQSYHQNWIEFHNGILDQLHGGRLSATFAINSVQFQCLNAQFEIR